MINISCDDEETVCNICTESFNCRRKANVTPCGHYLCLLCLKKLPKPAVCPFCRSHVDIGKCTEDLRLQEIGNLRLAKSFAENRPFEAMNCSKCRKTIDFSGLFTCVSCYPAFINIVIYGESSVLVEQMAMCCRCVASHETTHSEEYPPLVVAYNACIANDVIMLLPLAKQIFFAQRHAPYQPSLVACLLFNAVRTHSINQLTEDFWNILLTGSIEFLKFVLSVRIIAEIRDAGCMFLNQYIPMLQYVSAMGIEGYPLITRIWNVLPTVIRAIKVLWTVNAGSDSAHLSTVLAWEKVSNVIEMLWHGIKATDRGGFTRMRMDNVAQIIGFIKDTFPAVEAAAKAVSFIVDDEIDLVMLECTNPHAIERYRSYVINLRQLKAEALVPIAERNITILRAAQDALYESAR